MITKKENISEFGIYGSIIYQAFVDIRDEKSVLAWESGGKGTRFAKRRATRDAKNAREYLTSPLFAHDCEMTGLEPSYLIRKMKELNII